MKQFKRHAIKLTFCLQSAGFPRESRYLVSNVSRGSSPPTPVRGGGGGRRAPHGLGRGDG